MCVYMNNNTMLATEGSRGEEERGEETDIILKEREEDEIKKFIYISQKKYFLNGV
jgi:hypothetical protein